MYNELSFHEILELFLSGHVEELWQSEEDDSTDAGNKLWDRLPSVNDLRPLFYSHMESCLYWGTYIVNEGGDEGQELMDLMVCLAGSPFASVRYNVCSALWNFWDLRYADALILFLNDQEERVKFIAVSVMENMQDEDFVYVMNKLELDRYTHKKLQPNLKEIRQSRAKRE